MDRLFKNMVLIKGESLSSSDLPHTKSGWQGSGPDPLTRELVQKACSDGSIGRLLEEHFLPIPYDEIK